MPKKVTPTSQYLCEQNNDTKSHYCPSPIEVLPITRKTVMDGLEEFMSVTQTLTFEAMDTFKLVSRKEHDNFSVSERQMKFITSMLILSLENEYEKADQNSLDLKSMRKVMRHFKGFLKSINAQLTDENASKMKKIEDGTRNTDKPCSTAAINSCIICVLKSF